jgi:IS605 OrfB family transposase
MDVSTHQRIAQWNGARAPVKVDNTNAVSFTRTLRLKVKREAYGWLNAAAIEVNQVFNWCNETSLNAATRTDTKRKWMTGFDLCYLSAGATDLFERIGADTIQSICTHYADKRRAAKRLKLRWRISRGVRRSLGWVPFKAASLKRKGTSLRFAGKTFRVFEASALESVKWQAGCFAQDAVGDWWLCLPVTDTSAQSVAPLESVGIDLGLKDIAVTSDAERLESGRWTHRHAGRLATAQRRGHKRQAKRIHRKAARCRADALHKFSRSIVARYQTIVVGDVSSSKLAKTKMAKSVLDSGWGMLKAQLHYKGQQAGRSVQVVNERNTTKACSSCGALTGPAGLDKLFVREWSCSECGDTHDRDVNAARNILALRCRASVRGNESLQKLRPPRRASRSRKAGTGEVYATA